MKMAHLNESGGYNIQETSKSEVIVQTWHGILMEISNQMRATNIDPLDFFTGYLAFLEKEEKKIKQLQNLDDSPKRAKQ